MKEALLINRKIVRHTTFFMYTFSCFTMMATGLCIMTNTSMIIDVSNWPEWRGYLGFCGGFVLGCAFIADKYIWGAFKLLKKHNTLRDRIRLMEQNQ